MSRWDSRLLGSVVLCSLLWGSAFPAIKTVYLRWQGQGLEVGLPTLWLFAGIRFTLAGLMLLPLARSPRREWCDTPKPLLALFTLCQTFLQYLIFYVGIHVASGSLAALLVSMGSFWWMLLAPLAQRAAWPAGRHWWLLILGGAGVTLAVYAPGAGAGRPVLGALLFACSTLASAVALVVFPRLRRSMGARAATGYSLLGGGLGLAVAGSPALLQLPQMFDGMVVGLTLWLAFVSAAAFSLWNHLTTLYPVHTLATYRFLLPLCGVFESFLFLPGERPGWGFIVGGSLVLLAMAGTQTTPAAPNRPRDVSS